MTTGMVPNRVLILLVSQDRYVGNYGESPFTFARHSLSRISLMKNGHNIDKQYIVSNEDDQDVNSNLVYIYMKLHQWLGQSYKESCGVTYEQFKKSLCCYPFDLTPRLTGWDQRSTTLITEGDLSVKLEFNTAPKDNLIMLFYCEYKSTMEIDKYLHVKIN